MQLLEMAYHLLKTYCIQVFLYCSTYAEESKMNLETIDESKCDHAEKEIIEGVCLSFDMLKGVCLETMEPCVAVLENDA